MISNKTLFPERNGSIPFNRATLVMILEGQKDAKHRVLLFLSIFFVTGLMSMLFEYFPGDNYRVLQVSLLGHLGLEWPSLTITPTIPTVKGSTVKSWMQSSISCCVK